MNEIDPDIKFTYAIDWDGNKVSFLDTTVRIDDEGYIQTSLFVKKNAMNALLLPMSCHRPTVTRATVFGLALRIRRICSNEEEAEVEFKRLEDKLLRREYDKIIVQVGINKARAVPRETALKRVEKNMGEGEGGRQHRLIVEYDRRRGPLLREVLEDKYNQMIERDQRLKRSFPKIPRPTFKRGGNIKELLCRAKLPPRRGLITRREGEVNKNGVTRCNKGKSKTGCAACPYMTSQHEEVIREIKVYNTGEVIPVRGRITCKTEGGFLYFLWSKKDPSRQYLGCSGHKVGTRLGEHRRDILNKIKGKVVAEHFANIKSDVRDLVFVPFMRIRSSDPHVLKVLEKIY